MEKVGKKILIIAPHADDEVLGCGGYMLSEISKGSSVHVLFGAVGGGFESQSKEIRLNEIAKVSERLGFSYSILCEGKDAELDTVPDKAIISKIDEIIREYEPDELFVNYPSRHQDHKKLYECSIPLIRARAFMPSSFNGDGLDFT